MNKKSQLQFAYRCSVLMESGISLTEVLSIIIRMEKSRKRLKILLHIRDSIEKGIPLSKSIVLSKANFDPTLLSMIAYGESAGILALSMRQAAEIMEKRNEIKKKVVGVFIYPSFIALATVVMTLFLVMYIFPKIIPLLSSMNITLPLLTRIVRKLYELLSAYGILFTLILLSFGGLLTFFLKKNMKFRFTVQSLLIVLPLVGEILKKYYICSSCRASATLLDCGQTLPAILEQNSSASLFEPYKRAWYISRSEVLKGITLSESLHSFKILFPSIVPDMLSIGERTGSLSSMFHHVSRMYEQEMDDFIKHIASIMEPALMICMGLIVGSVALSIILPIYEITNHLGK